MLGFIARRLVQSIFVMLTVSLLAFALFRFVGDPVAVMVGQETSIEDQERLRDELGLNDPVITQYARFLGDLATGNFGFSYRTRQPIGEMILDRMPATLELGLVSLFISLIVGIPAGIYTALRNVEIGWWKTSFLTWGGLKALILPAITLGVYQLTLTMRLVRAEMQDVLSTDFITFAKARGIEYRSIHYRKRLSMAGYGPFVPRQHQVRGRACDGHLSGPDRPDLCDH